MRFSRIAWVFLWILLFALAGVNVEGGNDMEISSAAFKDGDKIPMQYVMPGAGGKISPYPLYGGTHLPERNRLPFPWLIRTQWPRIGYIGL